MAASAVSLLAQSLRTLIQDEVVLLRGVEDDMRKLYSTLSTILAVLDDAEMKQHQDKPIQDWLRKLKDASYVVRDILDECETEARKWKIKHQSSGRLKKVWTSAITCYPAVNLSFRHQIGNRMRDITERMNEIAEERKRFHLNEGFIGKGLAVAGDSRETTSALPPLKLFGRRDDTEKIVKVLTKDVCDLEGFSVYPIIGMGGLGKTTLAQMTFNDGRIISHFDLKIWVYVSQNFNVKMVMNQIIESTPGGRCEASSLDSLQKEVKTRLSGKRYLLVLDDAWSEDQEEWDKLKPTLASGSPGSCVVVTTRSERVALIIGTLPTHYLLPLSEDDCWLLFRQRAFGPGNEERPDLVDIGKEIVKKCGGVPLAAKALGGLMRFRRGEKEWISVNESNLWNIPEDECSILPALRLSYYNLSLELRRCFSYCAIFLKGSQIEKDKVIQLWMANGFISSKNKVEVEDVGNGIWNELNMRSFFQDEEKDRKGNICFKMHDLMHDLAQFVMGDECQMMKAERSSSVLTQRVRHATLIQSARYGYFPEALEKQRCLHTILHGHTNRDDIRVALLDYSWVFKNCGSLRVVDFALKKLPGSIGNLKHLTYLNLSGSDMKKLPSSICGLLNLQTLNLNGCSKLRTLPKKMNKLRGLRHLCLIGCSDLKDTPAELGKITGLKTLSLFVVGKNNGRRVGELQHLDLGGELEIRHLERVKDSKEAREANLAGKHNLRTVRLSWRRFTREEVVEQEQEQVIEALEPHPNVEELTIEDYSGKELPARIFTNVTSIKLIDCRYCVRLPPGLGQLPRLKCLTIGRMEELEYLILNNNNTGRGDNNNNNVTTSVVVGGFSSLEELWVYELPNLKGFVSMDGGHKAEEGRDSLQQKELLPRLKTLMIGKCRQLTNLPALPALEILSISKLPNLKGLVSMDGGDKAEEGREPLQQKELLPRLEILAIKKCRQLTNLPALPALETLQISELPNLKGFVSMDGGDKAEGGREPLQQKELLPRLESLVIKKCRQLTNLPALPALETLQISELPNLKGFVSMDGGDKAEGGREPQQQQQKLLLPLLNTLKIMGCPQFTTTLPTLPALERLDIRRDSINVNVLNSISKITSLIFLHLSVNRDLVYLPDEMFQNLTRLQTLKIWSFEKLKTLPESISRLVSLKELTIGYCEELECLPEGGIGSLISLLRMEINNCRKLASLPNSIQTLTQLQDLCLPGCSPELKRQCQEGKGEDWYKIAHIPNIEVHAG